ncbi:uncharacterized protein N7484_010654 [Penicillium longicatenatum]|uniref:uncharacterized protein n=1 Tax=Penicillium longicatenatum TaxID=1561947 RepID=UPI00254930F3|nr:uncharacterized protein N7484_010654 [Penicillium longicatenatum]KAJ5630554.1 hypothetical protein N7484_010654 [Penicillium longicatenatum]
MAGADQKSFLGSFSPWSTPKSSTPHLDRPGADALQRSQGEDHTVTHRHRLSLRHYPSDCPPLKVRWFYAVDSPKRKPALLDPKKPDQKLPPPPKKFIPFSLKDSQSIENTYIQLSEIEDSKGSAQAQANSSNPVSKKVPVNEDYLFDVDVEERELGPAYWIGPIYEVRRGTWFFQDGSNLKPCEENLATQLEEGYLKLRPWRTEVEAKSSELATKDGQARSEGEINPHDSHPDFGSQEPTKPVPQTTGNEPSSGPTSDSQQYRLFGAYMNRIVVYQDASTAWINTDDFMSRVSTTVYQKLGGVPGTRVVRGLVEPKRVRDKVDSQGQERKPTEKPTSSTSSAPSAMKIVQDIGQDPAETQSARNVVEADPFERRPKSTLERQMSSLAGEPQNPAELEEQARRQEEQEMEDLREIDGEDREREVDHLVLVTHGIGQRLGLRLESINFIHDVNVLRKTLKGVYKASPDLQALNSAFGDSNGNCRVQVLPVCWRHLLDFPYRGVRQNRKELDLTDADTLEDDAYPSLADITLESVPAVRNLISDLAMDVLLYQSGYCEHISNIVKQECNRIIHLYKKRNPSFKGSISLCGHSLGSAILFDILCRQPSDVSGNQENNGRAKESEDAPDGRGGGSSALDFECEEFFCLGSPIALFQMLKGKTIAGYSPLGAGNRKSALDVELGSNAFGSIKGSKRDSRVDDQTDSSAIDSAPKCRDLYNIFHPSDPVSYRIEPLVSPAMASLKPQPLPSVKKSLWTASGQSLSILKDRMGQSVGSLWSNFTSGVASSLLNRHLGLNADEVPAAGKSPGSQPGHKHTQSGTPQDPEDQFQTLIDPDLETLYDGFQKRRNTQKDSTRAGEIDDINPDEQERKMKFEDAKVRSLNSNGRIDYSVQEGAFDISLIASIASHLTYWGDEDVNHFILSQMLSRQSRHRRKRT